MFLLQVGVSLNVLGDATTQALNLLDQGRAVFLVVNLVDLDHAVLHSVLVVVVLVLGPHLVVESLEGGLSEDAVILVLIPVQGGTEGLSVNAKNLLGRILSQKLT